MEKTALVTGSAGFIGFHLCKRLLSEGWTVWGIDGLTDYYDVQLKQARHSILETDPGFRPVIGHIEEEGLVAGLCGTAPFSHRASGSTGRCAILFGGTTVLCSKQSLWNDGGA
jgi:nucleoside-diphosphate-sugar epimerase